MCVKRVAYHEQTVRDGKRHTPAYLNIVRRLDELFAK
jgi:hypothetical protein